MLYFVFPERCYAGYEDYYRGILSFEELKESKLIVYMSVSEIPLDDSCYYVFFGVVPTMCDTLSNKLLINMEQLSRPIWCSLIVDYKSRGVKIYDYDLYQSLTYGLLYLPYQLSKLELAYLSDLLLEKEKKYDVTICSENGSLRRSKIVVELRNRGLKVENVCGWHGVRDDAISSSKLLLNVHYGEDYCIFEHLRCDRWLLSGQLVVSETGLSDGLLDVRDLLIMVPYEDLVNTVCHVLEDYERYYSVYMSKLLLSRSEILIGREMLLRDFLTDVGVV